VKQHHRGLVTKGRSVRLALNGPKILDREVVLRALHGLVCVTEILFKRCFERNCDMPRTRAINTRSEDCRVRPGSYRKPGRGKETVDILLDIDNSMIAPGNNGRKGKFGTAGEVFSLLKNKFLETLWKNERIISRGQDSAPLNPEPEDLFMTRRNVGHVRPAS